jgi:glutamate synthase domain-containing protein 2
MSQRLPGGIPDFVEKWNPALFRKVGYGLIATTALSFPASFQIHEFSHVVPIILTALTSGYWKIGLDDINTKSHSLRRNFPLLIHMRYIFESIRPEIQQYFIESDEDAVPYSRSMRSTIYQRSKGQDDTKALGTRRNVYGEGYEWGAHSMWPVDHHEVETRTIVSDELLSIVVVLLCCGSLTLNLLRSAQIGGKSCKQPYSASIFNISAMSYGALSGPAVSALNLGAKMGGFYHNTGEGGLSKFHLLGGDVVWNGERAKRASHHY